MLDLGGTGAAEVVLRIRLVIVALLVLLLLLPAAPQRSGKQKPSTTRRKVDRLKRTLGSVQGKRSAVRSALRKNQRQVRMVMGDIERVDGQLTKVQGQLEDTRQRLAADRMEQKRIAGELGTATQQLSIKREQLRKRLRAIGMTGRASFITTLLTSDSLGDFASRRWVLERIAVRDRQLLNDVERLQRSIAARKARQDQLVGQVAGLVGEQQSEQNELSAAKEQKKDYLGELRGRQAELRKQLDELDAESAALAAQIRAYQRARQQSGGALPEFRGAFMKPVAARLTSTFGMRMHPILRERRMHTGMDLAAGSGTPIKASAPGVVISAGYMRGYGYTVVIDHGGGISTLYAHCSRLMTSGGARVRQGQVIAAVGATGLTTGPHLHFEMRVNGRPVDPRSRL